MPLADRARRPCVLRRSASVAGTIDAMRRHAHPIRAAAGVATLLVIGVIAAACSAASIPLVSFDPASACTTDGRQPGAYPDLEALLPKTYEGKGPVNVDSGRNCTATALGTLAEAGVTGVRFAGATWDLGGATALTKAVFDGDGLTPSAMIDFYNAGAQANSKTEKLAVSDITVAGSAGRRLDVLQSDGTGQTIVAWPAAQPGLVHVLLAADIGDANVLEALAAFSTP